MTEHTKQSNPPAAPGEVTAHEKRFPCAQCGAKLVYLPGTTSLSCPYCGAENAIPQSAEDIRELDYLELLARLETRAVTQETQRVRCSACAAEMEPPPHVTAYPCPFCGADIVATAIAKTLIKPGAVLPFRMRRDKSRELIHGWLKQRWFAPRALKRFARMDDPLTGIYVPFWTYDCQTTSHYTGQRGDDYWVTESYVTTVNGKSVTRTRQVRRTRWTSVSGVVWNAFDDVLVCASRSLPDKYVQEIHPWDLPNLVPYADEYLSGFRAESYKVTLPEGFETAKRIMDDAIRASVRADIGGDHQRIHDVRSQHDDITFKHILLPIWVCGYQFKGKTYQLLVNGRTGEVQGERPYSAAKITLFILLLLAVIAAIAFFVSRAQGAPATPGTMMEDVRGGLGVLVGGWALCRRRPRAKNAMTRVA